MTDVISYSEKLTTPSRMYKLRCSIICIENDILSDVIDPVNTNLKILEDRAGTDVVGASKRTVNDLNDVYTLLNKFRAGRQRQPQSHTLLTVYVEQVDIKSSSSTLPNGQPLKPRQRWQNTCIAKLQFVELVGSEHARAYPPTRNKPPCDPLLVAQSAATFTALETVISFLARGDVYVPYRNSKVTHLLKDCISDTADTILLLHIQPSMECLSDTLR